MYWSKYAKAVEVFTWYILIKLTMACTPTMKCDLKSAQGTSNMFRQVQYVFGKVISMGAPVC